MSITIILPGTLAVGLLLLLGCDRHNLERDFFKKPFANRLERLRQYGLEDQYRIFRYGNDVIEPPLFDLANPIAERGAAAVPFLSNLLGAGTDDVGVRDILLVLEKMEYSRTYDVKSDSVLMAALGSRISGIKDRELEDTCLRMLQSIKDSR